MEPESSWHPHVLFASNGPTGQSNLVGVLSTDASQLLALSARESLTAYRVDWQRAVDPLRKIDGPFVLRHWEPPRSAFDEGDFIVGVFANAVLGDCAKASGLDHWREVGFPVTGDWVGILTPLTRSEISDLIARSS